MLSNDCLESSVLCYTGGLDLDFMSNSSLHFTILYYTQDWKYFETGRVLIPYSVHSTTGLILTGSCCCIGNQNFFSHYISSHNNIISYTVIETVNFKTTDQVSKNNNTSSPKILWEFCLVVIHLPYLKHIILRKMLLIISFNFVMLLPCLMFLCSLKYLLPLLNLYRFHFLMFISKLLFHVYLIS